MNKKLCGKVSPISGFPIEWAKYVINGEYNCNQCKHNGDINKCAECWDYGSSFEPKEDNY